ncbi:MAG: SDR family oxidoreductase [Desulfosarcinaceae bacterium]|jgi:3-oxoacyl-[acyl-carrier protein] reductase
MDFGIKDRTALVTAASRGLGHGCARQLAAEGCRVAICSRHAEAAETAAAQIATDTGAEVVGLGADVSRVTEVEQLLTDVRARLGDPDILVTNAGGPPPGTFATTAVEDYDKALQLNLMSAVHLIRGVLPAMQAKGWGRIIAITSRSVKQPIADLLLSNMARAGLTGFLKTVSTEVAASGITVNALLPGVHKTSRVEQLVRDRARREARAEEEIYADLMTTVPSRRIGDPDDFGAAAAFLASTQASFITGQNLLVDGGSYKGLL